VDQEIVMNDMVNGAVEWIMGGGIVFVWILVILVLILGAPGLAKYLPSK
jgi:hypothetical protein